MSTQESEVFQRQGAEFLAASEDRRREMSAALAAPQTEEAVWGYFQGFHRYWKEGGGKDYTEERCLNDLALLLMLGGDIDPRDIDFGLNAILNRADQMDHDSVQKCFSKAAEIARALGFQFVAKRMEKVPGSVWRSSTYRSRKLEKSRDEQAS